MVCDGVAPGDGGTHVPGVEVIYAGAGLSADDVIIATLERSTATSGVTVVSSDRAVSSAARRRGARTIESGAFLSRLIAGAARAGIERFQPKPMPALPLGDAEVGYWLREFGERVTHAERGARPPEKEPRASTSGKNSRSTPEHAAHTPIPKGAAPLGSRFGLEDKSRASRDNELGVHDAWLIEARRMWPDLSLDDLRMEKWLDGSASKRPSPAKSAPPKARRP